MRKFLLFVSFVYCVSNMNRLNAQCNGASVSVANLVAFPNSNSVVYSFDWTYVQGNASIQAMFYCNGTFVSAASCIQRLKDSAAGSHHVSGTQSINCAGTITVKIVVWTNPTCGGTNCTADSVSVSQSPLPADIFSFEAERKRSLVVLKWVTVTEKNNIGFSVERYNGSDWQEIGWVPTQAPGGNSVNILHYIYTDINDARGVSQYRLRQVNLDGQSKFTQIRLVNSANEPEKIVVYPNPSNDGSVNISFGQSGFARNISVIDITGKYVKQFNNTTESSVRVDNLLPGIYSVRIINVETGEQGMEKFVINKY
jgi:hypothetical protein